MRERVCVNVCVRAFVCVYMCVYVYVDVCVCMYMWMCVYGCVYEIDTIFDHYFTNIVYSIFDILNRKSIDTKGIFKNGIIVITLIN